MKTIPPILLLPFLLGFCFFSTFSQAAEVTWTGGTDANWSEDNNWDGTGGFTDNDSILFNAISTANLATNNDLTSQTVTGITVTNPAGPVSIGGNAFTLGADGITVSGDQNLAISAPITLSTAQEWNIATGRQVTIDGTTITSGPAVPITLTGGGTFGFADGSPEQPNWEGGVVIEAGTLSSRRTEIETNVRQWFGTGLLSLQGVSANSATLEIRTSNNAGGSNNQFTNSVEVGANRFSQIHIDSGGAVGSSRTVNFTGNLNMGDDAAMGASIATTSSQTGIVRFNGDGSNLGSNNVFSLNTGTIVRIGDMDTDLAAGERVTVTGGILTLSSRSTTVGGKNFSGFAADVYALEGGIRFVFPNGNGTSATFQTGRIFLDNSSLQISRNITGGTFEFNREIFASRNSLVMGSRNEGGGGGNSTSWQFGTLNMEAGTVLTTQTSAALGNTPQISFVGDLNWQGAVGFSPVRGLETSHVTNLPGTWNRGNQATMAFVNADSASSYATTATGMATNNVIGFSTYNNNFAFLDAGAITELATYTALASGPLTSTENYEATGDVTVDAGETINALKINNAAVTALDLNSGILTVQSGGILFTGTADYTIENGQLGADDTEVIIHQRSATASLVVNAAVGDGPTGQLTKTGVGTLILSTPQTFGGQTAVNQGTLALSGSGSLAGDILLQADGTLDLTGVTGGNYTLGSSQTLAGFGTVDITGGTLTIEGGLSPGNSTGVLTVEGDLTLASISTTTMEIASGGILAGTDFDQTVVTGLLTWGGALVIDGINSYDITSLGSFQLFDSNSFGGNFSSVTVDGTALNFSGNLWSASNLSGTEYTFNINDGVFAVVPEPSTWGLITIGLMTLLLRRRRA